MKLIKFPYEYFLAQVVFGLKLQKYFNLPLHEILIEYTDVYNSLTNQEINDEVLKGIYQPIFKDFINKVYTLKTPDEITDLIYSLFQAQNYAKIEVGSGSNNEQTNEKDFGCFGISFNDYNKEKQRFKLHFKPIRKGLLETTSEKRVGDLSSYYMNDRREEFKQLLLFTRQEQFRNFKYLLSSTWLQNIPNYQSLFPPKYRLDENREKREDSFLGLWGQFIKWDLSGNKETLNRFLENLKSATKYEEVINAFPYPVYKISVPLEEMYSYWRIK